MQRRNSALGKYILNSIVCLVALFSGSQLIADEKIKISYGMWDENQLQVHRKIINEFETRNPDIEVEIRVVPWGDYWKWLQAILEGGEAHDVFWMNAPNFSVYVAKGVLLSLQSTISEDGIVLKNYPQGLVDMYSYNGDIYGIPKDFDTIALYYNKDLFDAAGVDYPDDTWTWDELKKTAKMLTSDDQWGFAAPITEDQAGYWNLIFQNGGQVLSDDGKQVLLSGDRACEAILFLHSFIEDGISPSHDIMQSFDALNQLFPSGRVGMVFAGSWMTKTYAEANVRLDIASLPTKTNRATIIHGVANAVWAGTKHPEAARALVEFMASHEVADMVASSGTVIPAYKGYQKNWINSIPEMNLAVHIDSTNYAVPYPTSSLGSGWNDSVAAALQRAWVGDLTPLEACAVATDKGNEYFTSAN